MVKRYSKIMKKRGSAKKHRRTLKKRGSKTRKHYNSKGGKIRPNSTTHFESEMDEGIETDNIDELLPLGFDDAEIEMYIAQYDLHTNDIINAYLEIARHSPFNQTWTTYNDIIESPFDLNVERYPGRSYNKRDIAKAVLEYFDDSMLGGKIRNRNRQKKK